MNEQPSKPGREAVRRFLQDECGADLVEFSLSAVLLLLVIFGIIDCSRAVYVNHYLAQAARDGVRYAMVRGSSWSSTCSTTTSSGCVATSSNVSSFVASQAAPGVSSSFMTVTTTWPGTNAGGSSCSSSSVNNAQGCVVNVQVQYSYQFVMPFLPKNALTMSSTAAATILE